MFSFSNRAWAVCGASCLLWAIIFFLTLLTPYMDDNYLFSKAMTPGYADFIAGQPIEKLEPMTLTAALQQALSMYQSWCGRFLGNLLVYCAFLLPYRLYAVLSALLFVVYVWLLHICVFGRCWRARLSGSSLLGLAALLWAGLPSFGSAFFWISVGGITALVGQALFLIPYRLALDDVGSKQAINKTTPVRCCAFFLLSFLIATLDYPTSAAMPVTALVCVVFLVSLKIWPKLHIAGFLGISLGGAVTLLAPGNAARMQLTTDPAVHLYLASSLQEKILSYLWNLPRTLLLQAVPLILLFWAFWTLYRRAGKAWWKEIPVSCFLFLLPALVTHAAYFFTAWPPQRAFATTAVQFIVAACIAKVATENFTAKLNDIKEVKIFKLLSACLILFCIFSVCFENWKFYQIHLASQQRDQLFAAHKGEQVFVPPLPVRGDRYMVLGSHLQDLSYDPQHRVNRAIAAYWGLRSVALVSPQLQVLQANVTDLAGRVCSLECRQSLTNRLELQIRVQATKQEMKLWPQISLYYYGNPGLTDFLPEFLANFLVKKFQGAKDWRLLFVPLLYARADVTLSWQNNGDGFFTGKGHATLWGIYPEIDSPFWLVRPGAKKTSFDLVPLEAQH